MISAALPREFLRLAAVAMGTAALACSASSGQNAWTWLGPEGGAATCFSVNPEGPSIVLLGSPNGIFRSADGGLNWVKSNLGLTNPRVHALLVDPTNFDRLLAATEGGIVVSLNGGVSWQDSSQGLTDLFVEALTMDSSDPSLILAATHDGIFKSVDGGQSWADSNEGVVLDRYFLNVVASPSHPQTFYAVSIFFGVYRSDDAGDNWQRLSSGPNALFAGPLAIDPVSDRIFVLTEQRLLTSPDGGEWTPVSLSNVEGLAFDPGHPSRLLASTTSSLQYSDDGLVFKPLAVGGTYPGQNLRTLAFAPGDPQILFAAGVEGTFRSQDGGGHWERVQEGLRLEVGRSLSSDPLNPFRLYAGTNRGEMRSHDGGLSWERISSLPVPGIVRKILVDPDDPARLVSAHGGTIRTSPNAGLTWTSTAGGDSAIRDLIRDPSDSRVIWAGSGNNIGLFRSDSGGEFFSFIANRPLTWVNAIAIHPQDSKTVHIAGPAGLYKTLDDGENWEPAMEGLAAAEIHSLEIDPNHPDTLFAGTASQGVFKTTDGGMHWISLDGPAASIIRSLLVDPADTDHLWVGTWGDGVFFSPDGGETFTPRSQDIESPFVWELSFGSGIPRMLYASTLGGFSSLLLSEPPQPAPFLSVEMRVSGSAFERGLLVYTLTVSNSSPSEQVEGQLLAALSPFVDPVELRASVGAVVSGPGDGAVTWEGTLDPGGTAEIVVLARVLNNAFGRVLTARAQLSADLDGDGTFDSFIDSVDPDQGAGNRLTVVDIGASPLDTAVLAVPYGVDIDSTFVGVAMANLDSFQNGLEYVALDDQGTALEEHRDQSILDPNGQYPFLTTEVPVQASETVAIRGTGFPLEGFFMIGDYGSDRLDGLGAPLQDSQILYIDEIQSGADWATHLYFFNPDRLNDSEVSLKLLDLDGSLLTETAFSLAPFGSMQATAEELFGPGLVENAYLRADASRPVRGFALLAGADRFVTLPARTPASTEHLWVPQFFWDDQGGTTQLRLLNTGNAKTYVHAFLHKNKPVATTNGRDDAAGEGVETRQDSPTSTVPSVELEIEPGAVAIIDPADFLDTELLTGGTRWVEIQTEGESLGPFPSPAFLLGSTTYDGGVLNTRSSLPMVEDLTTEAVFLQVAQSTPDGIFQGLAIVMPEHAGFISVDAYDSHGNLTASKFVLLLPGQRFVGLLDDPELFGEGFEQVGGFLRVNSVGGPDRGMAIFALFGGPRFLAALQARTPEAIPSFPSIFDPIR